MSKYNEQIARSLDIWEIISEDIVLPYDDVILRMELYLDVVEGLDSSLTVFHLDEDMPEDADDPTFKVEILFSEEETQEMYRKIKERINLPSPVYNLRMVLVDDEIPVMKATFVPIMKEGIEK